MLAEAMSLGHPKAWANGLSLLVHGNSSLGLAPNHGQAVSVMRLAVTNGIIFAPNFYEEMRDSQWGKFFLEERENGEDNPPIVVEGAQGEAGPIQDIDHVEAWTLLAGDD